MNKIETNKYARTKKVKDLIYKFRSHSQSIKAQMKKLSYRLDPHTINKPPCKYTKHNEKCKEEEQVLLELQNKKNIMNKLNNKYKHEDQ